MLNRETRLITSKRDLTAGSRLPKVKYITPEYTNNLWLHSYKNAILVELPILYFFARDPIGLVSVTSS